MVPHTRQSKFSYGPASTFKEFLHAKTIDYNVLQKC